MPDSEIPSWPVNRPGRAITVNEQRALALDLGSRQPAGGPSRFGAGQRTVEVTECFDAYWRFAAERQRVSTCASMMSIGLPVRASSRLLRKSPVALGCRRYRWPLANPKAAVGIHGQDLTPSWRARGRMAFDWLAY